MPPLNRRTFVASSALLALAGTRLAGAQEATPAATGPISVEGAMGTLELEAPPQRVVALEWSLVENVLALGVQPAGIGDVEGYRTWVNVPLELSDEVADVGQRLEPSMESIAALEPDLILTSEGRHEPIFDALANIAPTLMIPADVPNDDVPPLEHTYESFRLIAAAIEEAGKAGAPFVVVQAFIAENVPTMRIFSNESQIGQTLTELGLENAWSGEGATSGFDTVTVEALVEVPEANFFYIVQDTDDIFAAQLAEDPIWNSLPFVQEDRTYAMGGDTWTFGGPRSIEVIVEKALAAFLAE